MGCVEGWLRYRLLFAASKKLRTKRPGVYPLIERERESRLKIEGGLFNLVTSARQKIAYVLTVHTVRTSGGKHRTYLSRVNIVCMYGM